MTDAATLKTPLGAGHEVLIERIFEAPIELVFDCFTDPGHFKQWWGPLHCQNEIYALDARPGGEISLRMAGPGYDHVMGGEFVQIERPRRLVFLTKAFGAPDGGWGIINRNTVTFETVSTEGMADATRMVLHTLVERAEGALVLGALAGMRAGWSQSFERLGDLVGGGGTTDVQVAGRQVILARAFDAPPERVWEALTQPELFQRWFAGGVGRDLELDARPGGHWSLTVNGADGTRGRFWGDFAEVEPPSRLTMTWGFDEHEAVEVVYTLTEEWGRTVLTRAITFPNNVYRARMLGTSYVRNSQKSYGLLADLLR
ncbi:MAG TPA: SRPBCC domain-containing protein [Caulobacteraceae bacterium]|jgi:uncharacterized protein YndB with AHSA1/START domain